VLLLQQQLLLLVVMVLEVSCVATMHAVATTSIPS
jgi:hypothetical protein